MPPQLRACGQVGRRRPDMPEIAGSIPATHTGGWYIGCAAVLHAAERGSIPLPPTHGLMVQWKDA